MNFSEVVRNVLEDKNLRISDLARMTGYTPQYMYDLLAGNRRWNETTINKTCEALGIEIIVVPTKKERSAG
ncbi:helix-turn-helix transcriptional regulator [Geobacillus sp. FSL W8-0032]|uniref:HTH cro/C1-type domain-containing protein n=1 Tax=Geobacillus icigianus TaxID=1430331 RepID=A0ABU6BKI2_9BACL|nr:helix-turn-helix transcriptional regulator [Geobacillus icigianus]MEB3752526.1 hypothetical protein [Geobacillus icigianus]